MTQVAGRWSVFGWNVCGYLVVRFALDGWLWTAGVPATASSALAVPLGVLFGLPAAVGLAVGVFVADSFGAVSVETVIESLSVALIAAVAHTLWQSMGGSNRLAVRSPRWWATLAAAGVCGITAGSALLAWGSELIGLAAFYFVFWSGWLELLAGMLVVTPPLVLFVALAWHRADRRDQRASGLDAPRHTSLAIGGLPFVWAGLGTLWSVGFQLRQRIPLVAFEQLDLAVLYYWIDPGLFGRGGRRLQVVFGAVMLLLLFDSLREAHSG